MGVMDFLKTIGGGLQSAGRKIGQGIDEYDMWQKYGPQWKEVVAYEEAKRRQAIQEAEDYEKDSELKRRYMEAQLEYLEALKNKANQPPAPPSASKVWAEREATAKISADTPGTPEWVMKEATRKKGVVADLMKWAKDAVDPSTAFPEEFAQATPAQQRELMEEYQRQVALQEKKDAPKEPKESEDIKRWRQLQRSASAPAADEYGTPTTPNRGEVLAEAINRALAEGVNMQEIPIEERMRAAMEASIKQAEAGQRARMAQPEPPFGGLPAQTPDRKSGMTLTDLMTGGQPGGQQGQPGGMEEPQFPEGAPQTPEEAEAKLMQAEPAELEATLKALSEKGMELEQGLADEIQKAMDKVKAEGMSFEEAEQKYPSLFAAFRKIMQAQMQAQPVQPGVQTPGVPQ